LKRTIGAALRSNKLDDGFARCLLFGYVESPDLLTVFFAQAVL
jgi:hypothetical protein